MGHFSMHGAKRGNLRDFLRNSRGTVSVMMAFSAIPFILAAGAAIDFARISREQVEFAAAVDSAALAIAASPRGDLTGLTPSEQEARMAELELWADAIIAQNYSASDDNPITSDLEITDSTVTLTAEHALPTTIMAMVGIEDTELHVLSEVTKAGNSIEVSLVLDITGSMSGSKIASLRTAAKNFVDTVVAVDQVPFYSKVALVPYSMGVNVGTYAVAARGSITSGTSTTPGSANYRFRNPSNAWKTFAISNCVSERTGAQAYTDAPVSTNKVGRNYPSPANTCPTATILPLTSNKTTLKNSIDTYGASGSTAGQIGVAWGWYMLSRDFGLFSGSSQPAAYGTEDLKKIAVLMTDGDFNSPHCNGVISKDAGSGSGSSDEHINCNATNGSAFTQSLNLCTAMKAKGILVYTIAFNVASGSPAQSIMNSCASGAGYAYDAANETQLQAVFQSIGKSLLALRLSK